MAMFNSFQASDIHKCMLTGGCALIGLTILYRTITTTIRKRIIQETTALYDVQKAGKSRSGERIKGTAVVCGGSIAGLFAARVCADHFEDVLIIEPESWLATDGRISQYDEDGKERSDFQPHARTRIMQYDKPHILYPLYLSALRQLNPDTDDELRRASARIGPAWRDFLYKGQYVNQTFPHRYPKGDYPMIIYASRACIETVTRRLLYEPGGHIRWMTGTVTDFGSVGLEKEIDYVSVRSSDDTVKVPAALVIDCTGMTRIGAKVFRRLHSNGKGQAPFENYIDTYTVPDNNIAFRYYVKPEIRGRLPIPGGYDNATLIYLWVRLGSDNGSILSCWYIEGHRLEIRCYSLGELPTDHLDVIPWAQKLKGHAPVDAWFIEMIKMLQEDAPVETVRYQLHSFSWIHYEKIPDIPSNFIACGDSVMQLSPGAGQGLTKAAIEALTLDRVLRDIPASPQPRIDGNFSKNYFQLLAKRSGSIWDGMKTTEYGFKGAMPVKGETLQKGAFARGLGKLLLKLIIEGDERVGFTYWSVRMFLAPRIDMLHPMILLKALALKSRIALGFTESLDE